MASNCEQVEQGKRSWPELVGKKGEHAEAIIEKENPSVNAEIIPEGIVIAQIYICNRVVVWVNKKGIVISTPSIG
ncbi:inhibitor of trypsin and hageman factor-like [Cynara cardunculus var. scolymus]|uniref:Proteinase inhibitor I13, potato inhibitor I n=1 Tax=Cynara cardunculus var. scolymus TaxID=59895 RepID=A0A103XID4_CYNCS|nr:inhibitor of trypsin and hageman factor-like [Cynara cardunculus var. scolymus]KVH91310.1 Proteinase inhibitor I13, potato inhibitor I [Cynara cardunculus var. scolymus]